MTKEEAIQKVVKQLGYVSFDDDWGREHLVGPHERDNFWFCEVSLRMFWLLVSLTAKG